MDKSYSEGLEGVVAGRSSICDIDEEGGGLCYRGYPIEELAQGATYEEVAFLLLSGHLPNRGELAEFSRQVSLSRELPPDCLQMLRALPRSAHPMDVLRTAISYLGTIDPDRSDSQAAANYQKSIRLLAQLPTILAAYQRMSQGQSPLPPDPDLSHAQQMLWLLFGEHKDEVVARALDVSLILYAEHEFNSSTFAARVTASSLSDLYSALTAAVGSLKGPLHGGANEAVMQMLLEIDDPESAEAWVVNRLNRKERIMGFGHRVLKKGDSRSDIIKTHSKGLGERLHQMKWFRISEQIERVMQERKGLLPNLDFYTASVYYLMGIPIPLYTPIFACSRIAGWTAHVLEQHEHNRLIRPRCLYTGPKRLPFVPLSQRV